MFCQSLGNLLSIGVTYTLEKIKQKIDIYIKRGNSQFSITITYVRPIPYLPYTII